MPKHLSVIPNNTHRTLCFLCLQLEGLLSLKLTSQRNKSWGEQIAGSLWPHAFAFFYHWNNRGRDYSSCRGNWGSSLGKTGFLLHHEDRNIWKQTRSTGDSIVLPCPELRADEDSSSAISRTGSDSSRAKGWVIPQGQDSWHPGSWLAVTVEWSY